MGRSGALVLKYDSEISIRHQVEMSSKKLHIQIWILGEMLRLEI